MSTYWKRVSLQTLRCETISFSPYFNQKPNIKIFIQLYTSYDFLYQSFRIDSDYAPPLVFVKRTL